MKHEEEELPFVDMDDVAEWIQDVLLEEGTVVKKDDILRILDLELEYMIHAGLAVEGDGYK